MSQWQPKDDAERDACSFPFAMCGNGHEGFMCNRTEGHEGDHVAAAGDDIVVFRWPQDVRP